MADPTSSSVPSSRARSAVLLRLVSIGVMAVVLAPAFAWLFQREPPAGIAGAALFTIGASYLYLRKETVFSAIKALLLAVLVAAVFTTVIWLLRPIWGAWLA